jgi:integrase
MATRRGNNEGGIRLREDGGWEARVFLGYGTDGRPDRKSIYGKTRQEVSQKMIQVQREAQQGIVPTDDRVTVAQYLTRWLETVQQKNEEASYVSYKGAVDLYIIPIIGKKKLAKLTPADVDTMMSGAPTVKTGNYARRVLHVALNRAIKRGEVYRNAAALTDSRRTEKYRATFLTLPQAKHLLKMVSKDPLEGLYTVALALGMRKGEAVGLRWSDVDLDAATLTICQQIQRSRITKGIIAKDTKNHQVRTLDMPPFAVAALRRHRTRQVAARLECPRWKDTGYVFTSSIGTPIDASNLSGKFHQMLAKAELPHLRWHELRHSAGSLALAQGASMQEVQAMLGHSQISVTMDYYAHLMSGTLKGVADRMEAAFASEVAN